MAKKTSKYFTGKTFETLVCDAIRHHTGCRKALESKRDNAFDDRDSARAELASLSNKHGPEALKVKERHSDAIIQIEDLSKRIKWHSNQVDDLVEKADEPGFEFLYEMPEDGEDGGSDVAGQIVMGGGGGGGGGDGRPVGRPAGSKPGAVKPEAPDPSKGDGVDEHLKAGVQELNLDEEITAALIAKGFTTVGRVAALIEKTDGDIIEPTGLSASDAAVVRGAVAKYRKAHRSAMREAESGDGGGVVGVVGRKGR